MRRLGRFLAKLTGFVVLVVVLLSAAGYLYERHAEDRDKAHYPPPGQRVPVGDRELHIRCMGTGSPTVIIETGSGIPSFHWWQIQAEASRSTQVCTYDRAGYGWSDAAPPGRSIEDRAKDLHSLLANTEISGPYVLVGHSYGGFIVRLYARDYPDDVAGVVLVDAAEEGVVFTPAFEATLQQELSRRHALKQAIRFGIARILISSQPRERAVQSLMMPADYVDDVGLTVAGLSPAFMDAFADEAASIMDTPMAMRRPGGFGTLGDLPLTVIESGKTAPEMDSATASAWHAGQARLSKLSTRGTLTAASNSAHNIYVDQPQIVLDAIASMVNSRSSN